MSGQVQPVERGACMHISGVQIVFYYLRQDLVEKNSGRWNISFSK